MHYIVVALKTFPPVKNPLLCNANCKPDMLFIITRFIGQETVSALNNTLKILLTSIHF